MKRRFSLVAGLLAAASCFLAACSGTASVLRSAHTAHGPGDSHGKSGFEVWIADQSDTRPGVGRQLLIYKGSDLRRRAAAGATPIARLDLGAETADTCRTQTGRNPVRPHMILFNRKHIHAIVSFVASGHVVIFDAETRTPLNCFQTTIGSTGTRQAHAAFPAPDGSACSQGCPLGVLQAPVTSSVAAGLWKNQSFAKSVYSGGSPVNVSGTDPHHPPLCGLDLASTTNRPPPRSATNP